MRQHSQYFFPRLERVSSNVDVRRRYDPDLTEALGSDPTGGGRICIYIIISLDINHQAIISLDIIGGGDDDVIMMAMVKVKQSEW